jgi:thioredoxin reductase (NADPH)
VTSTWRPTGIQDRGIYIISTDSLVIGAGPAGLTAATYLGRFHRPVLVIDSGASRARWIPRSHNIPGFPSGIEGKHFLTELKAQASRYGAAIRSGEVRALSREENSFVVHLNNESIRARYVLLATGAQDYLPPLPGAEEAVLRSLVKVCPICDAFEASGKSIAILGKDAHGYREAAFLRTYSERVTLIHLADVRDAGMEQRLAQLGIEFLASRFESLSIKQDSLSVHLDDGTFRHFDVCYTALGCSLRNQLAASIGAALDEGGALLVTAHQQTSIPGLYAAGDVVKGLSQVVVAAAEAAIAATDIHNQLRKAEGRQL